MTCLTGSLEPSLTAATPRPAAERNEPRASRKAPDRKRQTPRVFSVPTRTPNLRADPDQTGKILCHSFFPAHCNYSWPLTLENPSPARPCRLRDVVPACDSPFQLKGPAIAVPILARAMAGVGAARRISGNDDPTPVLPLSGAEMPILALPSTVRGADGRSLTTACNWEGSLPVNGDRRSLEAGC